MSKINVEISVTLPEEEMPSYQAWNYGKNLLKSSLQPVRQIGFDICMQLLELESAMGADTNLKAARLRDDLANGNPV